MTEALLQAFLAFWRQHGEPLLKSSSYPEIAPHLVLMAFLHRVINGGGTLEREYAIGRDRMDLCLRYGEVTLGIELKVWRTLKVDLRGCSIDSNLKYNYESQVRLPPVGYANASRTRKSSQL